jgi:hypothetical protein
MQVRISNLSKLVPKETLFALFSIIGDIINLEQIKTATSDLTEASEWNCLFANLSDAQRALHLSPTELGDRQFFIEFCNSLCSQKPLRHTGNKLCRTGLLLCRISFPTDVASLKSFFPNVEEVFSGFEDGSVLIEFSSREDLLGCCQIKDEQGRWELFDASCCYKLPTVVKEPTLYGVPASKLLSVRTFRNEIPATPFPTKPTVTAISNQIPVEATPLIKRSASPERAFETRQTDHLRRREENRKREDERREHDYRREEEDHRRREEERRYYDDRKRRRSRSPQPPSSEYHKSRDYSRHGGHRR